MPYKLNLDISRKNVVRQGIQIFLNWTDRADGVGTEPALVFRRPNGRHSPVYVLPMSYIHNVMASSGFGLLAIVSIGAEIAEHIGFARLDKFAAKAVSDAILEFTDDLVMMPPEPPTAYQAEQAMAGPKAELAFTVEGETVYEAEVAA